MGGYDVASAFYVAIALAVGTLVREYVRAFVTDRLGDPTPRRWGWLSPNPRAWVDPFGTAILPAMLVVLWAAGLRFPPFAYAKPLPLDPSNLRRHPRDVVVVSVAGPVANVALAAGAGVLLRAGIGAACDFLTLFVLTNATLAVFHLLPIPGLDGARMLALVMPPRAREVYRNLDHFLILFILAIYFLIGGPALGIVDTMQTALSRLLVGRAHC